MEFTPILPTDLQGNIDPSLLEKAEEVCIKSAALAGTHTHAVLDEIKNLLRNVNSYYSNKIESEGTHPIDIDKALKKEFSKNSYERKLQILSLAHIDVQRYVETYFTDDQKLPFSSTFIRSIHKELYTKTGMEDFLHITHEGQTIEMVPGTLRDKDVAVANHIAPRHEALHALLHRYETLYHYPSHTTQAYKLIQALSAHHRLTWIHPFLDGNGRTARLALDGAFVAMHLTGYGLWNISRGLARNSSEYKRYLAQADMIRQGDFDGRGALSTRGLKHYVEFMLQTALDQVTYMESNLKLNTLSQRLEKYIKLSKEGLTAEEPLSKYALPLMKELLIAGELQRGAVANIIGTKDRTASSLIQELIQKEYITSNTPKSPIRLKFNARFASYLFPDLIPPK